MSATCSHRVFFIVGATAACSLGGSPHYGFISRFPWYLSIIAFRHSRVVINGIGSTTERALFSKHLVRIGGQLPPSSTFLGSPHCAHENSLPFSFLPSLAKTENSMLGGYCPKWQRAQNEHTGLDTLYTKMRKKYWKAALPRKRTRCCIAQYVIMIFTVMPL